jgi:hypothetical protein
MDYRILEMDAFGVLGIRRITPRAAAPGGS